MSPGEIHREPFIHLVDLGWDRALIAWGAFFFERTGRGRWEIVDDEQLPARVGRHTCIGTSAEPYGHATVQVLTIDEEVAAEVSTDERAWVWVEGLEPETDYRYQVKVDGAEWAAGELWDWVPSERGGYDLAPARRRYDLRFRTWPHPNDPTPPVRFVAMGDYGVGMRSDAESSRRQRRIADVLEQLVADHDVRFVLSLGDNIYQGEQGRVD
jgi:tartrate-resistant acid phosphatase type 5